MVILCTLALGAAFTLYERLRLKKRPYLSLFLSLAFLLAASRRLTSANALSLCLSFLYGGCLAIQDFYELYVGPEWMGFSLLLVLFGWGPLPDLASSLAGGLLFALPAFYCARKGSCGQADPWFLLLFGFELGLSRMLICLLTTLPAAFVYLLLAEQKRVPFLPFLVSGWLLARCCGWGLAAAFGLL